MYKIEAFKKTEAGELKVQVAELEIAESGSAEQVIRGLLHSGYRLIIEEHREVIDFNSDGLAKAGWIGNATTVGLMNPVSRR